jgi:hypothetical protein
VVQRLLAGRVETMGVAVTAKGNRTYQRMKAESAAKQELKMNGYR